MIYDDKVSQLLNRISLMSLYIEMEEVSGLDSDDMTNLEKHDAVDKVHKKYFSELNDGKDKK